MGELGALFNPGMRHELEERRARAARREEEGNARDGDLRIDLDSGVAVINAPGDDDADGRSDAGGVEAGSGHDAPATTGDTPAPATTGDTPVTGAARSGAAPDSDPAEAAVPGSVPPESADPDAPAEADPSGEAAAAPLRPRGKRAMSAGRR